MKTLLNLKSVKALCLTIVVSTFLISCQSENDMLDNDISELEAIDLFTNSTAADDAAEFEIEMSYLAQDEASNLKFGRERSKFADCVVVTKDSINKILILDFGDGCKGPNGVTRKGKMIINYDGDIEAKTASRVISFDNYFVNNKKYGGNIEISKAFISSTNTLISERTLKDFTVAASTERAMKTNGTITREWVKGVEGEESEKIVKLTGSISGVSTVGRAFKKEIVSPVILNYGCYAEGGFLRVAGTVELAVGRTLEDGTRRGIMRTVDYGDGDCDNEYTVTINGKEKVITRVD